jgi:FMN phosphatase YigB (HAD superfamily)
MVKPQPQIYQYALDQLHLRPNQAGFVGHATDELEGAKAMGLYTIAFAPDDPTIKTDAHLVQFSDLMQLAKVWS